jgi:putative thioredoxin
MTDYSKAAFRGAVDLSSLTKPKTAPSATQQSAPQAQSQDLGSAVLRVPALVVEVNQATIVSYLKISERMPVLVDFFTSRSESSVTLTQKLEAEVANRNGAIMLLRIDGDANQPILEAFQITAIPAVAALLKGQPVPMFTGDQEPEVITQIIDKVMVLAQENGLVATAVADDNAEMPKPMLPPRHQAAYDAIDAEDYATAVKEFEAALAEAPADEIAAVGLAQAKLLVRTDKLDLEQVLQAPAETLADVLLKADVLAVIGHFELSFKALLDTFGVATKEDREVLRQHLVELFKVAGAANPDTIAARIRLTNLLY